MNVAEFLLSNARRMPDAPAVALGSRTFMTYARLAARVTQLSGGLRTKLGLEPGERVAIYMQNCVEYFEVLFAIWHAGLVAVPVNAKLHARELAWILENAGAKACFALGDVDGVECIDTRSRAFRRSSVRRSCHRSD